MNDKSDMLLTEDTLENATVLRTEGKIDSSNAKQFGEKMTTLIESGCKHLIVDLSKVSFMTSAGFRALLVAGKSAAKTHGAITLCGLNENIHRLFELGGFLDLFPIYDDTDTALNHSS